MMNAIWKCVIFFVVASVLEFTFQTELIFSKISYAGAPGALAEARLELEGLVRSLTDPNGAVRVDALAQMTQFARRTPELLSSDIVRLVTTNLDEDALRSFDNQYCDEELNEAAIAMKNLEFIALLDSALGNILKPMAERELAEAKRYNYNEKIRAQAAWALYEIIKARQELIPDESIPLFFENLNNNVFVGEGLIRFSGEFHALAGLSALGTRIVPYLAKALSDPDSQIRADASLLAWEIVNDKQRPDLISMDLVRLLIQNRHNATEVGGFTSFTGGEYAEWTLNALVPYLKEASKTSDEREAQEAARVLSIIEDAR